MVPPTPPQAVIDASRYGIHQALGQRYGNWIEGHDADIEPSTPISTLTWANLIHLYNDGSSGFTDDSNPTDSISEARRLGYSIFTEPPLSRTIYVATNYPTDLYHWQGIIARGLIIIGSVFRASTTPSPHMSDVTLAVYKHFYPVQSLRHILVDNIVQLDTSRFFNTQISFLTDWLPTTFERGSDEYEGLLGTQCGRLITHILLGAFGPGGAVIDRIAIYGETFCLRFDITVLWTDSAKPRKKHNLSPTPGAPPDTSKTGESKKKTNEKSQGEPESPQGRKKQRTNA